MDNLCDDQYLERIVEEKRKYQICDAKQTEEVWDDVIGGIRVRERPEKLPEAERQHLRQKIPQVQHQVGVENKESKHWPELQGVYKRLWQDAGHKDERMENLRGQVDQLIKVEL